MKLYYSHRYRDADPAKQAENLVRAEKRFEMFRDVYAAKGIELVAPWIWWAKKGMSESMVWDEITFEVYLCDGLLIDFDGGSLSDGMVREINIAGKEGKPVTCAPEPRDSNEWNTRRNKLAAKKRAKARAAYVPPRRST